MDILFSSEKLRKLFNNQKKVVRRHGKRRAKKIELRLSSLKAATVLEDMRGLPGRCHELKGDRLGQISLDLDHPYRLIFKPINDPIPRKIDGGLDWTEITAVMIIAVEDTHG